MKKNLVILTYYKFPCSEAVLENVFAKEIGKTTDVYWLFQSELGSDRKIFWHNSKIVTSKMYSSKNNYQRFICRVHSFLRLKKIIKLLKRRKADIILVRDMPAWVCIISIAKCMYNFKIYYQCTGVPGDMELDYACITGGLKAIYYYALGKTKKIFDKVALRVADLVFPISDYHKFLLQDRIPSRKIIPLTMGADKEWSYCDRKRINFLEKFKSNSILIGYFGSLSFLRDPLFMMFAFRQVIKDYIDKYKMLLIGAIPSKNEENIFNQFINDNRLCAHVMRMDKMPKDQLVHALRYCDITLSLVPPRDYYKISSPTKMYESLVLGIPVIANREIHEQRKVIEQSGGGILCDYNTNSLKEAIGSLFSKKEDLKEMGIAGKEYILKHYEYRILAEKVRSYFK